MNSTNTDQTCPCESGRPFAECCGVEGRSALNADLLAKLDDEGNVLEGELTGQLMASVKQASTSPDMYFARYNFREERAYMVKMTAQHYQDSVFLDPGRIKGSCVIESNFNWIESIAAPIAIQNMPMIFHTAFCGSTLMSQALNAVFNVLPLREPEPLSNLLELFRSPLRTEDYKDHWLDTVLKLLSKRYDPETVTVVKTNDHSNPMMIEILNRYREIPTLFMYTPLDEFVAGCLKAQNRRDWIKNRYRSTYPHAKQLFAHDLESRPIGEQDHSGMAAFYWSYNIALFFQSWRSHPERIRSLDFNTMLSDPMGTIEACGQWFGIEKSNNDNIEEKIGALFGVYSKNSRMTYSPQQRREDIQKQLADYSAELDKAKQLASELLGDDYPDVSLPAALQNG
jgi:hypothetical protein